MATQWISPTWRMPENSNQSKVDNYSLNFDGANDEVAFASASSGPLNDIGTGDFTVSVWGNATTKADYGTLIGNWSTNGLIMWRVATSNVFECFIGGDSFTTTYTIPFDDTWHHYLIKRSGTNVTVYVDGVSVATGTSSATLASGAISYIGNQPHNSRRWSGKISQPTIYDSALTTDQITALYNSGTPVNPMALTPLPTAYYPLGGSSTGSASTLTVPNDAVPSATVFDFDGSTPDFINCGNSSVFDFTTQITISAWVKTTDQDSINNIVKKDDTGSNRSWNLSWRGSTGGGSRLVFWNWSTDGTYNYLYTTGAPASNFADGNWHHVVATYDGTADANGAKIYLDGVLMSQGAVSRAGTGLYITTEPVEIGDGISANISNTQLWNTSLSAANVTTLYNNGVPLLTGTQPEAANLKAWYKLNVDTSTWDGNNWIIGDSTANYTTALDFDGNNDYIDCGSFSSLNSGTAMTVSLWFKGSTYITNARLISCAQFEIYQSSATAPNTQGRLYYKPRKINGNSIVTLGGTSASGVGDMVDGNWHHLCLTFDYSTTTAIVYEDGVPVITNTSASEILNPASSNLYIGSRSTSKNFIDGSISNISIFNTALDAAAVSTLFNSGTPQLSISGSPISWWKLDNTTTGIQDSGSASNNGTNNGATEINSFVSTLNGESSGMTTANLVTSDLTRSIPYSSYSMTFDGIDDFISIYDGVAGSGPSSLKFTSTDSFSISCWINMVSTSGQENIISFRGTPLIWLYRSGTTVGFILRGNSGSSPEPSISTTTTNGEWHHVVAIRDYNGGSPQLKLYIDNVAVTPVTDTTTGDYDTYDKFSICNDNHAGGRYWFDGNTSNVAIFNSTLTEDQITTIYNGGVPNSISSLSPVGWWSLAGDSYYNGSNWICPDLGSGGNNGTSSGMGGTELVGDGPGSTANGVATSMDIPGNLKGNAPNSSNNAFSVNMNPLDRVTSVPG